MLQDILLLTTGIVVGAMNAIAGGGMLIGFPVLVALGLPPLLANATGGLVTAPGQLSSAFGYRQYLRTVPKKFIFLVIPCLLGAIGGALLLRTTPAAHFAEMVPLLVLFGVVLFAFQPYLHIHVHRHVKGVPRAKLPLWLIGIMILPLSLYGGYFGAGYGFLMLAFLGFTDLPDAHAMNGLKNLSAVCVSVAALVVLYGSHLIQWRVGIIMAIGSTIGGYVGARGAQKVSSHRLRIVIICIGLAAVVYLVLRNY